MSVTVDHRPLAAENLGLKTLGQVLAHLQKDSNRLVVHVLIDGEEPDLNHLGKVKAAPVSGHTVFIETADPREMAVEVLDQVASQLDEADRLKTEAAELLQRNQNAPAMEKLAGCFTTWQHAQESVLKTAQLLRIDLAQIQAGAGTMAELFQEFSRQIRQIRLSLENRDFVTLCDLLLYETTQTSAQWRSAIDAMKATIGGKSG
ncbi:MAG TPA: hypothetical protein VGR35_08240 [Tepidisphaeraceae bacterium]|nr:hypothetical protein [Tepidisphaeraceae bacterium]